MECFDLITGDRFLLLESNCVPVLFVWVWAKSHCMVTVVATEDGVEQRART